MGKVVQTNRATSLYHTGLVIDEVLARYAPAGNLTLLTDALQSVIAQAKDDQTIQNYYAYSPYGEAQALGVDEGNSLQYTGRENDGTGLYYYRARYYDPVLKRFISDDPIGIAGGLNLYSYVRGSPASYVDPTGKVSLVVAAGVVAVIVVGAVISNQSRPLTGGSTTDDPFSPASPSTSGSSGDDGSSGAGANAGARPTTGDCSPEDFDYCYGVCGGRWNTQGCYVSYQWRTRMWNLQTGGRVEEQIKFVNCHCGCD